MDPTNTITPTDPLPQESSQPKVPVNTPPVIINNQVMAPQSPSKQNYVILALLLIIFLISTTAITYFILSKRPKPSTNQKIVRTNNNDVKVADKSFNKAIFKSETNEYQYKFMSYDIQSGQIDPVTLPEDIGLSTKLKISNDRKNVLITTGYNIYVAPLNNPSLYKKIFTSNEQGRACIECEGISEVDTIWSANSSEIIFSTHKFLGNGEMENIINLINIDGSNHRRIKMPYVENQYELIEAYDSIKNEIYYHTWSETETEDELIFNYHTMILNSLDGSVKKDFPLLDDESIDMDSMIFDPEMKFIYFGKYDNDYWEGSFKLIQHSIETGSEKVLFDIGEKRANYSFLNSLQEAILIYRNEEHFPYKVTKVNLLTGMETVLNESFPENYLSKSISPDGRYIWLENAEYTPKDYKLLDLQTNQVTSIQVPDGTVFRAAPLEKIYWLP